MCRRDYLIWHRLQKCFRMITEPIKCFGIDSCDQSAVADGATATATPLADPGAVATAPTTGSIRDTQRAAAAERARRREHRSGQRRRRDSAEVVVEGVYSDLAEAMKTARSQEHSRGDRWVSGTNGVHESHQRIVRHVGQGNCV